MQQTREQIKASYSISGEEYDQVRLEDPRGRLLSEHDLVIFDQLFKPQGENLNILEVGAGTGRFTTLMLEKGHSLLATDINEAMLKVLREKVQSMGFADKCTVRIDDIFNLSSEDEQFDYGVCLHVIPRFLTLDDQRQAMIQLGRVLKKGGVLLFNYRNKSSLLGRFYKRHTPSTQQMRQILEEAGLEIIEQRGKHLVNRKILNITPLFLGRLIAMMDRMLWRFASSKAWDIFVVAKKK